MRGSRWSTPAAQSERVTVQPNAEASEPTVAPFDFEQDTRTIREWLNHGVVAVDRLVAELRRAASVVAGEEPSGDFAAVRVEQDAAFSIDQMLADQAEMRRLRIELDAKHEQSLSLAAEIDELDREHSQVRRRLMRSLAL
jgi:hypothetical protein